MNPLFVSLFAFIIIKEKLTRYQLYSLALGFAGLVVIVIGEQDLSLGSFENLPLGITFAVLAGITFALYTVLTKRAVSMYGNRIANSASFLIGGAVLTGLNLIIGKSMLFEPIARNIILILYLGIIVTGVAYLLYFEGMKELSAARASVYFFLKPALASILAYIFLAEHLSLIQTIGIILVMLALSRRVWMKYL
jgi:drug/metabolite transporter (DMT)-like permease